VEAPLPAAMRERVAACGIGEGQTAVKPREPPNLAP
jgi:hypothetical protein